MNKCVLLLMLTGLTFPAFTDSWLKDGQTVFTIQSADPEAPLILDHNATNGNQVVNRRTVTNLIDSIMLSSQMLPDTNGIVFVDSASGYHQMHIATNDVTFRLADRTDTNTFETFFLNVFADVFTVSFATNFLDTRSVTAMGALTNKLFGFRFTGPANLAGWFISEVHPTIWIPDPVNPLLAGLTNGLIFYTKFDGSARDETGIQTLRGTNTASGEAIPYTNGMFGSAAVFSPTNHTYFSYTNSATASLAPFVTNAAGFTMAWWEYKIYTNIDHVGTIAVGPLDGNGPLHGDLTWFSGENVSLNHYGANMVVASGNDQWYVTNYTPPTGEWIHTVMVWDTSGTMEFYSNGAYHDSASIGLKTTATGHFLIGNNWNYAHWTYNGYLDEMAMWNRTLSVNEIEALFNDGTGAEIPYE